MFCSCKKETLVGTAADISSGYFPLRQGNWIIYNVDSVAHLTDDDGTDQPDTSIANFHFKIKEVVDTSFIDGEGKLAYRIMRYRQTNDTLPWDFESVWVASVTGNSAQRVEDNIRYIKLSFPINIHTTWNGNAYNEFTEEEYSYTEVHAPFSLGTFHFDSTITVLQAEDNNFLTSIYKEEKYAQNVGMIYKQKDSLAYNGIQQVINGFEYKETIEAYGN